MVMQMFYGLFGWLWEYVVDLGLENDTTYSIFKKLPDVGHDQQIMGLN